MTTDRPSRVVDDRDLVVLRYGSSSGTRIPRDRASMPGSMTGSEALLPGSGAPSDEVRRVAEGVLAMFSEADGVTLWLLCGDQLVYMCGAGTSDGDVGSTLPVARSLPGLSAREASTVCSPETQGDERVHHQWRLRDGSRSLLCSPLSGRRGVFGVLELNAAQCGAFQGEAIGLLDRLSEVVAVAVEGALEEATMARRAASPQGGIDKSVAARRGGAVASELASEVSWAHRIGEAIDRGSIETVLQPIADLSDGRVVAVEALTRFTVPPIDTAIWFKQANRLGLGVALELATVGRALALAGALPDDVRLSINVSPAVLASPGMLALLCDQPAGRLIIELTEHLEVTDYDRLRRASHTLREAGALLAVDDVGAGYSSLLHVVKLAPEMVKLDRCLIQDLDLDPVRCDLGRSLVDFASRIDAVIVAEGIENRGELEAVRDLGIPLGQGYLIARPSPVERLSLDCDHIAAAGQINT
jgi:EAL domain-containing protein (putative c-di-GMP-specific phosphodiesterase class I)